MGAGDEQVRAQQRALDLAISSRTTFIRMVGVAARGAAVLMAAATPLGPVLAFPAAWRFVDAVVRESHGDTGTTMTSTTAYAELVLRINFEQDQTYSVEPRLSKPGEDAYVEPDGGPATFDVKKLNGLRQDAEAYGAELARALFADPNVLASYHSAVAAAATDTVLLRLRLSIDVDDPKLHALRWETLRDPVNGEPLATSERILFSRYLRSGDMRSVQWRPKSDLRALVLVANPVDLNDSTPEGSPLAAIDVDAELGVALSALGDIPSKRLVGKGQATLSNLIAHLREGWDVLYVVCHGEFFRERALLYFEDDDGKTDVVPGVQLAAEMARLMTVPRLVVLASCQSAGSGATVGPGGSGALAAVGPLLAREGVPAVLAMQGNISIESAGLFMPRFFEQLGIDGHVERAVAAARGEVQRRERPDAWMPVLFTRLTSGCIWTVPARSNRGTFEPLPALLAMINDGECVPILGPGILEFLLGSQQDIAQRWADTYRFPMAAHVRRDLPQVAQYLAVSQRSAAFPHRQLQTYLSSEMRKRHADELLNVGPEASLDELIRHVGRERRTIDPAEPFGVLASLPVKTYITINPDNLLTDALRDAGRAPEVDLFHWTDDGDVEWPTSIFKTEPNYRPTAERPLVYHLFGQLGQRDSVVLTEDDYFTYLVAISRGEEQVPPCVTRAWNKETLLFLGFRIADWHFRVLFQSIMKQEGSLARKQKPHVAVQLDLQDGTMDPERARAYLERYFAGDDISIYWGSCEDFIRELHANRRVLTTSRS